MRYFLNRKPYISNKKGISRRLKRRTFKTDCKKNALTLEFSHESCTFVVNTYYLLSYSQKKNHENTRSTTSRG